MKNFQALLDRYGSDFDRWPAEVAQTAKRFLLLSKDARDAYDRLSWLESGIAASRPRVSDESVRRVVNRSILAIARGEQASPLIDRFRMFLAAPVPRVAFVMGLTAIGFALGIALGAPEAGSGNAAGGPVLTASADDVLF